MPPTKGLPLTNLDGDKEAGERNKSHREREGTVGEVERLSVATLGLSGTRSELTHP